MRLGGERYLVEIRRSSWDTVGFLCGDYRVVRRGGSTYGVYSPSAVLLRARGSPRATIRAPGSERPLVVRLDKEDRGFASALAEFINLVQALDLVRAGAEWVFSEGELAKLQHLSLNVAGAAKLWERLEAESFYRAERVVEESIGGFSETVARTEEEGFRLIGLLAKALFDSIAEALSALKDLGHCGAYLAPQYVYGRALEGACLTLLRVLVRESKERDAGVVWVKSSTSTISLRGRNLAKPLALYVGRELLWMTSTAEVVTCEVWCLEARPFPTPLRLSYLSTFGKSLGEDAASVLLSFVDRGGSLAPLRTLERKSRLSDKVLERIFRAMLKHPRMAR